MSGAVAAMLLSSSRPLFNCDSGADDVSAGVAFAGVGFESDGDIISTISSGSSDAGDWITPKALAPGGYTLRASLSAGDALDGSSSALDTDIALTGSPNWSITQTGAGSKASTLAMTIKLAGGTVKTGTVTLSAQAF